MISLELYIFSLLVPGVVSLYFIIKVFRKQLPLLKVPFTGYDEETQKTLVHFRNVLFSIVLAILVISVLLGSVNILTLFIFTGRPEAISISSYVYSLGVHILLLLLSYLVSQLYRLANNQKVLTDETQYHLENELRDEKNK